MAVLNVNGKSVNTTPIRARRFCGCCASSSG